VLGKMDIRDMRKYLLDIKQVQTHRLIDEERRRWMRIYFFVFL